MSIPRRNIHTIEIEMPQALVTFCIEAFIFVSVASADCNLLSAFIDEPCALSTHLSLTPEEGIYLHCGDRIRIEDAMYRPIIEFPKTKVHLNQ